MKGASAVLGQQMMVAGFAVGGSQGEESARALLADIVDIIGMNTGGMKPAVWTFPLPDGKGGAGQTISQPFTVLQPLVESFASLYSSVGSANMDTWSTWDGFYLLIHSCCRFDPAKVRSHLEAHGFPVRDEAHFLLKLQTDEDA